MQRKQCLPEWEHTGENDANEIHWGNPIFIYIFEFRKAMKT